MACPVRNPGLEPEDVDELGRTRKRSAIELQSQLSSLADWFRVGFECIELDIEPNSCGGCLALGSGYVSRPRLMKTANIILQARLLFDSIGKDDGL